MFNYLLTYASFLAATEIALAACQLDDSGLGYSWTLVDGPPLTIPPITIDKQWLFRQVIFLFGTLYEERK
jgi:hypothetical protein